MFYTDKGDCLFHVLSELESASTDATWFCEKTLQTVSANIGIQN